MYDFSNREFHDTNLQIQSVRVKLEALSYTEIINADIIHTVNQLFNLSNQSLIDKKNVILLSINFYEGNQDTRQDFCALYHF